MSKCDEVDGVLVCMDPPPLQLSLFNPIQNLQNTLAFQEAKDANETREAPDLPPGPTENDFRKKVTRQLIAQRALQNTGGISVGRLRHSTHFYRDENGEFWVVGTGKEGLKDYTECYKAPIDKVQDHGDHLSFYMTPDGKNKKRVRWTVQKYGSELPAGETLRDAIEKSDRARRAKRYNAATNACHEIRTTVETEAYGFKIPNTISWTKKINRKLSCFFVDCSAPTKSISSIYEELEQARPQPSRVQFEPMFGPEYFTNTPGSAIPEGAFCVTTFYDYRSFEGHESGRSAENINSFTSNGGPPSVNTQPTSASFSVERTGGGLFKKAIVGIGGAGGVSLCNGLGVTGVTVGVGGTASAPCLSVGLVITGTNPLGFVVAAGCLTAVVAGAAIGAGVRAYRNRGARDAGE